MSNENPQTPDSNKAVNCMGDEESQEKFKRALAMSIAQGRLTNALKGAGLLPNGAEFDTIDFGSEDNPGMTLIIEGQVHPAWDDEDFSTSEPIQIVLNIVRVDLPGDTHVFTDHKDPKEYEL